jgi:hypothetical protein
VKPCRYRTFTLNNWRVARRHRCGIITKEGKVMSDKTQDESRNTELRSKVTALQPMATPHKPPIC